MTSRSSTEHAHPESLSETMLPWIVGGSLALAAASISVAWLASAGTTLAGSASLPREGVVALVRGVLAALHQPDAPWQGFAATDATRMPHSIAAWWIAAALPLLTAGLLVAFVVSRLAPLLLAGAGASRVRRSAFSAGGRRTRLVTRKSAAGRVGLGYAPGGGVFRIEPETHVCVIAPPGAAKTAGVVIPALLEWSGPAIALSTKPDVLKHTRRARGLHGPVCVFDPLGESGTATWSVLAGCESWEVALVRAEALASAAKRERESAVGEWWDQIASDLIAPLLHAAALSTSSMRDVHGWVTTQDTTTPRTLLAATDDARVEGVVAALAQLDSLQARDDRARTSTWMAAAQILRVYRLPSLHRYDQPILDLDELICQNGTLYIVASDEHQALLRPLVVALVDAAYRTAFERGRDEPLDPPFLMALDETANIAPLRELPSMLAQSRAEGIVILTAWQDLSQIRHRYGTREGEILASSHAKVILGGATCERTIRLLQTLCAPHGKTSDEQDGIDPRRLDGRMLVAYRDHPPFLLRPRLYFSDRTLRRISRARSRGEK